MPVSTRPTARVRSEETITERATQSAPRSAAPAGEPQDGAARRRGARANVPDCPTMAAPGVTHVLSAAALCLAGACCPTSELYVRAVAHDEAVLEAPSDVASLGVQLSVEALDRWLAEPEILRALPTFHEEVELPLVAPLTLSIALSVESLALRVSAAKPNTLEVRAAYAVTLGAGKHLRFVVPGGALGLPAELRFDAGVALASRSDGGVSVTLDLTDPAIASFDVALELVPEAVREPLGDLLRPLAAVVARATLAAVHLFDVDPIDLGVGRLRFGLGTFEADAASNELFLGLRPNLSVPGAVPVRPDFARPLRGDVRLLLDGRLPEAAVRALLHDGALPRRFGGDLEPDPEGSRAFTLDSLAFEAHELVATFTLWGLCFPTFAAQIRAHARVAQNPEGRFEAALERLELLHADHYEGIIRDKLEETTRIGAKVAEISQRLLNEHLLALPEPFELSFRPLSYALGPERIEIEGTLRAARRTASEVAIGGARVTVTAEEEEKACATSCWVVPGSRYPSSASAR